ncbi:MAG: hypothetical protein ACLSUT_06975 [Christensenellales bacterium]
MGRITEVVPQKKNKNRVSVYIDGQFVLGLDALTALKNHVEPGAEISEERLEEIQLESEAGGAFDRAVKLVSFRPRTKAELKRFLADKGYAQAVVSSVMDKLAEYGFCDDFKFCRDYASAYSARAGINKIRADLMRLGAERDAIDSALEEIDSQEDEAFAAAERYIRTHGRFDMIKLKNHLYARGFTRSDIAAASDRIHDCYQLDDDDAPTE